MTHEACTGYSMEYLNIYGTQRVVPVYEVAFWIKKAKKLDLDPSPIWAATGYGCSSRTSASLTAHSEAYPGRTNTAFASSLLRFAVNRFVFFVMC